MKTNNSTSLWMSITTLLVCYIYQN